ncbi:MAG: homoserine dehydrogenase, partial [Bacillota bacterium]
VKDIKKKRDVSLPDDVITTEIEDIFTNKDIDLVVELIGGEEPAFSYIKRAIKAGKSIVTANKLVIAKHGEEIHEMARKHGVEISFEGSVAGGLPIIRPLKESLAANRIKEIYGILNGTTNYILTQMTEKKESFTKVLKKAQDLGFAERDPSSDISGRDAAYKISILSSIAFESFVDVESIHVEGIENIDPVDIELAEELGYVIKLVAIAKKINGKLDIRVHPTFISQNHPLALVNGVYNAVYLQGDAVGDVMSYGKGAGQMPTASAVVADIIQVARCICGQTPGSSLISSTSLAPIRPIEQVENSFYLRIQVNDRPGVMAQVTKVLGDNHVSLASVLQKHRLSPVVPLVLITHPVKEKHLNQSLSELKNIDDVIEINSVIRVQEETEVEQEKIEGKKGE